MSDKHRYFDILSIDNAGGGGRPGRPNPGAPSDAAAPDGLGGSDRAATAEPASSGVPDASDPGRGAPGPGAPSPGLEAPGAPGRRRTIKLPNADLPIEDQGYFCGCRPEAVAPFRGIVEKFLNWARANSLWVLGFGTGCGAIELRPLMTARFDMYRYGIQPRPTPRQSSVFIIGGYASVKTLKRIVRSYEQMQNPKFVIGLGSCTINGGMYWDSYNTINRLDQYIPVDVYVAGCMPRPEAILAGFQKLKHLIREGKAEGANEYAENFDWYKANQKRVIKDWNMPDYNW